MQNKLTSLKLTDEEKKENKQEHAVPEASTETYPWGLELHLEKQSLEKLKFSPDTVGTAVMLHAAARVEGINISENKNDMRKSVTLQITDMSIEPEKTNDKEKAAKMFDAEDETEQE